MKKLLIAVILSVCSIMAFANSGGTPEQAKAMLAKTVTAVKADPNRAFFSINTGWIDGDLYPFCFKLSDGKFVAIGDRMMKKVFIGIDVRTMSTNGKMFGLDLYQGAKAGGVNEVSYMFFKPGFTGLAPETTFVTAVNGFGCGVGYYKPVGNPI